MSRFDIDKFEFPEERHPVNPTQGKTFLEILLQESAEANGEELPADFDEPLGEIPIPDRKKRFKFLRFPKLKAMLDQLDNATPEKTDGYVIMDEEASLEEEEIQELQSENRNDTEEFLNGISTKLAELGSRGKKRKNKSSRTSLKMNQNEDQVEEIVTKSICEDEAIVSETLAKILAAQGKKSKAIKMYEALSLKFPKKSRFFAEQIAKLK